MAKAVAKAVARITRRSERAAGNLTRIADVIIRMSGMRALEAGRGEAAAKVAVAKAAAAKVAVAKAAVAKLAVANVAATKLTMAVTAVPMPTLCPFQGHHPHPVVL